MNPHIIKARSSLKELKAKEESEANSIRKSADRKITELERQSSAKFASLAKEIGQQTSAERAKHPVLIGNADAVIPHHFGRMAIDEKWGAPYEILNARIKKAAKIGGPIPILFIYRVAGYDEDSNTYPRIALVLVRPEHARTPFKSSYSESREMLHAFCSAEVDVETVKLELRGPAAEYSGSISNLGQRNSKRGCFQLRMASVAKDGSRAGRRGTYSSQDTYDDEVINYQEPGKNLYVGWAEISKYIDSFSGSERMKAYRNLHRIAKALGCAQFGPAGTKVRTVLSSLAKAEAAVGK